MKTVWSDILSSALIGTDKKPFNVDVLPDIIKSELQALVQDSDEKSLLAATAMVHYYKISGTKPQKLDVNIAFTPIAEKLDYVDDLTKSILARIIETGYYEKEYLLGLWLDMIVVNKKIVTPDNIVPLIRNGTGMTKNTRSKIYAVIGERGKAILPLLPDFKVPNIVGTETLEWKEGSPEERRAYINELRKSKPSEALNLIQSDWNLENIVFKRSLIEILMDKPKDDESDFLKNLYLGEFAAKPKEKKTEADCRYLLAKCLLNNPNSDLSKYTYQNIQKYIGEQKKSGIIGFLTGNKESLLELPSQADDFFNADNIYDKYGINPKNIDTALYQTDVLYWFAQLLAILPLGEHARLFSKNEEEVFLALTNQKDFLATIEGKTIPIFLEPLCENVKNFRDQKLLFLILEKSADPNKFSLLAYADFDTFEKYVITEKLFLDAQVITHHPAENEDWSPYFSIKMVEATYKSLVVDKKHYYDKINQLIAKHLHVSALSRLEEMYQSAANDHLKEYWIKNIYQPVKTSIEIKSSIFKL